MMKIKLYFLTIYLRQHLTTEPAGGLKHSVNF
jgi:hypothetical protein